MKELKKMTDAELLELKHAIRKETAKREFKKMLEKASSEIAGLDYLTPKQKEVIRLHDEEGLIFKEVGKRMGLSSSRVSQIYHKGKWHQDKELKFGSDPVLHPDDDIHKLVVPQRVYYYLDQIERRYLRGVAGHMTVKQLIEWRDKELEETGYRKDYELAMICAALEQLAPLDL